MESEEKENRKGQVEQEMDVLEGVTAALIKKLEELNTRLQSVCRERLESSEIKEAKQEDESRVSVALALHSYSLRVTAAIDCINSIMERLEL